MILDLPSPWIVLTVEGTPRPWHVIPVARGRRVTLQLERASRLYQETIGRAAHTAFAEARHPQIQGAVEVEVVVVMARIKRLKAGGRVLHKVSPDLDKVLRNVFAGLSRRTATGKPVKNGGVIFDDARICSVKASKWYAADDEVAHTQIRLRSSR